MKHSQFIYSAVFAIAAVVFGSLFHEAFAAPPNVVLILSDDQAWTDYGFMDHPTIETPNLDRLASESALFRRGYVPTALCRPSLASIITGLYPHQHGIVGNDPKSMGIEKPYGNNELRERLIAKIDQSDTLPKLLGNNGYVSHQSGKWWEGNFRRGGFTEGMTRGFPKPGGRHGDDGLAIGRDGMEPVFDFIDQSVAKEKPFFCWYAPFMPHSPHNPPKRLLDKYTTDDRPLPLAKYYAMCEWFDETCGQLVDHIDERGIRDNTLVVYVCDNGWIQDVKNESKFAPRSKQSPYEGGVRTPIMFSWPGTIPPSDRDELCSSLDIMPTVLAATGCPISDDLPGLNLLPAIEAGTPIERSTLFGESFSHDVPDLDDPERALVYRWVIDGDWKLLLTYDGEVSPKYFFPTDMRPQLFNLANDPREENNVANQHPDIVGRLADKIDEWWHLEKRKTTTEWSETPLPMSIAPL